MGRRLAVTAQGDHAHPRSALAVFAARPSGAVSSRLPATDAAGVVTAQRRVVATLGLLGRQHVLFRRGHTSL